MRHVPNFAERNLLDRVVDDVLEQKVDICPIDIARRPELQSAGIQPGPYRLRLLLTLVKSRKFGGEILWINKAYEAGCSIWTAEEAEERGISEGEFEDQIEMNLLLLKKIRLRLWERLGECDQG